MKVSRHSVGALTSTTMKSSLKWKQAFLTHEYKSLSRFLLVFRSLSLPNRNEMSDAPTLRQTCRQFTVDILRRLSSAVDCSLIPLGPHKSTVRGVDSPDASPPSLCPRRSSVFGRRFAPSSARAVPPLTPSDRYWQTRAGHGPSSRRRRAPSRSRSRRRTAAASRGTCSTHRHRRAEPSRAAPRRVGHRCRCCVKLGCATAHPYRSLRVVDWSVLVPGQRSYRVMPLRSSQAAICGKSMLRLSGK